MNKFYSILGTSDISILLFGVEYLVDNIGTKNRKRFATYLPSWVGIIFTHMLQIWTYDLAPVNERSNYIIDETNALRIKYRSVCAKILKNVKAVFPSRHRRSLSLCSTYQQHQRIKVWDKNTFGNNSIILRSDKPIDVAQQNSFSSAQIYPASSSRRSISASELETSSIRNNKCSLTYVVSPSPGYVNFDGLSYVEVYWLTPTHRLPLHMVDKEWTCGSSKVSLLPSVDDSNRIGYLSLTDGTCANIIILTELAYTTCFQELTVMPVVRKEKSHYKSIGVCFLHKCVDYASMESFQEFTIQ